MIGGLAKDAHDMEPSVDVHHLAEYTCELQPNFVPVDIVV